MVWRVVNVPSKNSDIRIKCTPKENGDFEVATTDHYEICILNGATPEGLAEDIASVLTKVRDIGFEQGRAYIRSALGINE